MPVICFGRARFLIGGQPLEDEEKEDEDEKEEESSDDRSFFETGTDDILAFGKTCLEVGLVSAILYGLRLFPIVSYLFSVVEQELRDTTDAGR